MGFEPTKAEYDAANPHHYKLGDMEAIDVIKESMTPEAWKGYCKGNILKYVLRANQHRQPTVEHLRKARKYLDWWIEGEVNP